jgi:hypothetical protein
MNSFETLKPRPLEDHRNKREFSNKVFVKQLTSLTVSPQMFGKKLFIA